MISKITSDILEKIIIEIKKKNNLLKIHQNIVNPLICCIFKEIFPYILVLTSLILVIIILLVIILIKLMKTI
jgi:hypothetical protein